MKKQFLIIANWKMNPISQKEAERLFLTMANGLEKKEGVEIVICPPFVYLKPLKDLAENKFIFGSQDCFYERKGAFTGAISPAMLKDLGVNYVIVGHSERRKYFNETDETINQKIKAALQARLRPVFCVGEETRDTFDSQGKPLNEMSLAVSEQIEKGLAGVLAGRLTDLAIAYEPVWAISAGLGTGHPCLPDDAMKAALLIRKTLVKLYNRPMAEKIRILYGGSVDSRNAADYLEKAKMDGLLVGNASLNASEFVKIIQSIS